MAMRRTLAAGAILVLTGGLPLLLPTTANACSCAIFESPEDSVRNSETIFVGTPTEKVTAGWADIYEVDVARVFAGDVGRVTTVGTLAEGNGCGTSYVLGTEQLMFVSVPYDVDAAFEGYACGPYTGTDFDVRATVESVFGDGHIPRSDSPTDIIGLDTRARSWVNPVTMLSGLAVIILVAAGAIWRRSR